MRLTPQEISSFPLPEFRQFGILCCRRLAYLTNDKRFGKALRRLEQSLGPPLDDRMRRDAFNAANSAYIDIYRQHNAMSVEASVMCTLVYACWDTATPNLLGNFEFALSKAELLSLDQIRSIEQELLEQIRREAG